MNIRHAGGTGANFSANASAIPVAGFALLTTVPANPQRVSVEVQNQSASVIQVVRDDGADNERVTTLLATGGSAGTPGAQWFSLTFKGRVRVYGPAGSQVSACQE